MKGLINLKADTIARTIILLIALVNQGLVIFGRDKIPIADDTVYQVASLLATAASAVWAWWKNNSVTQSAIKADNYLKELKSEDGEKTTAV